MAREISEDLKLACAQVPDVELFEYAPSVTVNKISDEATAQSRPSLPLFSFAIAESSYVLLRSFGNLEL